MKRNAFKKLLSALITAVLLLSMLAGCTRNPATQTDPIETTGEKYYPIPVGTLVLNANASVEISYDAEGLVLNITGVDINGTALAFEYKDYYGKTCSEAVKDLIQDSIESRLLDANIHTIMVMQALGSDLPGTAFLETIVTEAQSAATAAGSSATITLITEAELDAKGYMTEATAERLLLAYLGIESDTALESVAQTTAGIHTFDLVVNGIESRFAVDAATGTVTDYQAGGEDAEGEIDGNETIPETQGDVDPSLDDSDESGAI